MLLAKNYSNACEFIKLTPKKLFLVSLYTL